MDKYFFQKLTPISDVEDMGVYTSALDFVFENDDLRNIAITGPYGAGKSSMIETYKKKSQYQFLHISLAHFEETGEIYQKVSDDANVSHIEKALEGKILNQLLHQINQKDIKQTSFKLKRYSSDKDGIDKDIIKTASYITLFALLAIYLSCFGRWKEFLLGWTDSFIKDILTITVNPYILLITSSIFVGLILFGIYKAIQIQRNGNVFKKFKFGDKELELFEESQDSYFDKYLNEVLYLFENSRADVIVFEDIDRFDMVEIFERLREINRLINERRMKEKKSMIRFFYLLRDDIFTNKDRTKFFDYIIPVIPVLNGSNAKEKFMAYFKRAGILETFDKVFLRDVSLYIDEMRVLQNIYNEYMIYSEKISGIGLDANKLLAMIIYKNIFPRDFNDLQLRQGYVYQVFEQKKEYIKNIKDQRQSEILAKQKELKNLDNELSMNLDELDAMFFVFSQDRIRINGVEKRGFANNIDMIKMAKKNLSQIEYYYNYYSEWKTYPFQEEYKNLSQNPEYMERKKRIEGKNNGKVEQLKREIVIINSEIEGLSLSKLQEIITDKDLEELNYINPLGKEEKFPEIKESPYFRLIQYLLTNGWIDEAYPDYISYFYEGSISRLEKEFLLSIADKKAKPYSFEIHPSLELLNNLDVRDFSKKEIQNYSLLEFLMKNREHYNSFYNAFLELLEDTENIKFVIGFYEYTKEPKLFVREVNEFWPEAVRRLIDTEEIPLEDKKNYLMDTILCSSEKQLLELNEGNCITEFINKREEFICVDDLNAENLLNGYKILQVQFETLSFDSLYPKMGIGVYQNNLYLLTKENIECIFANLLHEEGIQWSWGNAATQIFSKNEEPVCIYVRENMDLFLYTLFENAKEGIEDKEEICLSVLNDENASIEKRKSYIAQMKNTIMHLINICAVDLWDTVLECKAVPCIEENILTYYFKGNQEWTERLTEFINGGKEKLNFGRVKINEVYGKDAKSNFWDCVIKCMELNNQKYEEILSSMGLYYNNFLIQSLDEDKVEILIRRQIIRMTDINLRFVRKDYKRLAVYFAKINIVKYLEILTEELFSQEEMLTLLETDIHVSRKKELLGKTTMRISVIGKKYQPTIKQKILEEHFDSNDLESLLLEYIFEDAKIQETIKKIAIANIDDILDNEFLVALPLLKSLLDDERLELSQKQLLFSQNLDKLTKQETIKQLSQLNMGEFLEVFERKNPKFRKTVITENILNSFHKKGWVGKIKEEEFGGIDYYRAYSKDNSKER